MGLFSKRKSNDTKESENEKSHSVVSENDLNISENRQIDEDKEWEQAQTSKKTSISESEKNKKNIQQETRSENNKPRKRGSKIIRKLCIIFIVLLTSFTIYMIVLDIFTQASFHPVYQIVVIILFIISITALVISSKSIAKNPVEGIAVDTHPLITSESRKTIWLNTGSRQVSVCRFRVEKRSEFGERVMATSVQMVSKKGFTGTINEGDQVVVYGKKKHGVVMAKKVYNKTTKSEFRKS